MAYAETNSLIVRGTLAQIEQVKRLVGEMDVPRKQIEMSLWIIDIKKTELDRLGVNWSGGINIGNRLAIGINQSPSVSTLDGSRFLASV
ncbi:EscC/YscC/HrcC family type III secretion system outer membrane ring protein, partial [Mycobacterium tuberculosis]|nr:EscC/YscC/HrcC family type III secretion system outer membrane ring protein [Mycobacterium tuberculosis]